MRNLIKKLRNNIYYRSVIHHRKDHQKSQCLPPFLIVSSGSSGSHLLGILLDSHSKIAVGPELNVFNKLAIYQPFSDVQKNINEWLNTYLPAAGYAYGSRFFDTSEAYFWNRKMLPLLAQTNSTHREFFDAFFGHFLYKRKKQMWGEKSPSNAACIENFWNIYPQGKIIHIVRDGQDVVASLKRRGLNIPYATGIWLYYNAASYPYLNDPRTISIRYEDLVNNTQETLKQILTHLELVDYEPLVENREKNEYWKSLLTQTPGKTIHNSWKFNPLTSPITNQSVGKYMAELNEEEQNAFWQIQLTEQAQEKLKSPFKKISQYMIAFGYQIDSKELIPISRAMKKQLNDQYEHHKKREIQRGNNNWLPLIEFNPTKH